MNIKTCLERGYLRKIIIDNKLINKELKESDYDYSKAILAHNEKDYKWSIVKCYYSMFHAAKAMLFKLGYLERKHIAIIIVLEDLNKKGKLSSNFVNYYKASISAREDADYHYSYSKDTSEYELEIAEKFNDEMKKLINKLSKISFIFYGHKNILSTHKNTFEFTKDHDLTLNGDCIVGVKADFDYNELIKLVKNYSKIKIIIKVDNVNEEINCNVNKEFNDENEIVIRKTDFVSKRTLGINANKAAIDLDRKLISKLKDPNVIGTVEIVGI